MKIGVSGLPSWWLSDSDDVCNWDSTSNFIECDSNLVDIVSLSLESHSIQGSLTSGIEWPNTIETIVLSNNSLNGTFDLRVEVLPNALQKLEINGNSFNNLLVTNVSEVNSSYHGNLTTLSLSNNNFGEWFEWINLDSFSNLQRLYLDNCSLELIMDWSVFPSSLSELQIADNYLYGSINLDSYQSNGMMLEDLYLS